MPLVKLNTASEPSKQDSKDKARSGKAGEIAASERLARGDRALHLSAPARLGLGVKLRLRRQELDGRAVCGQRIGSTIPRLAGLLGNRDILVVLAVVEHKLETPIVVGRHRTLLYHSVN